MAGPSFFPTAALEPVASALTRVAYTHGSQLEAGSHVSEDSLAAAKSNSVEHVAVRLAAAIGGYDIPGPQPSSPATSVGASEDVTVASNAPETNGSLSNAATLGSRSKAAKRRERGSPDRHTLSPADLAKEVALVHAFGVWAEAVISPPIRMRIALPLVRRICSAVHAFGVAHHLPPDAQEDTEEASVSPPVRTFFGTVPGAQIGNGSSSPSASLSYHVWPSRTEARRHVLQCALASRYGTAAAAPNASLIAGPPLVVCVRQVLDADAHVKFSDEASSLCGPDVEQAQSFAEEWKELVAGTCILSVVDVDSIDSLRSSISQALKLAIKNEGLSPVLVVLEAELDTGLGGGAGVSRAICESYGARLHVEGRALAMLGVQSPVKNVLEFNVSECVLSGHSLAFDVGSWFGVANMAVVTFFTAESVTTQSVMDDKQDPTDGVNQTSANVPDLSLARVMSLWWMLERVLLQSSQQVINSAAEQSVRLVDKLSTRFPYLEQRTVGAGGSVLISCSYGKADPVQDAAVNLAIVQSVSASLAMEGFRLTAAKYCGQDWIVFSPLQIALQHGMNGMDLSARTADEVARYVLEASQQVRLAKLGASAFLALAKQSEYLEVTSNPACDTAPLYYGAVRIVPLGIAGANGHWRRDREMIEQVEKFTCALSAGLDASTHSEHEWVLYDDASHGSAPFLCIGPVVDLNKTPVTSCDACSSFTASPLDGRKTSMNTQDCNCEESVEIVRESAREAAGLVRDAASHVVSALSQSTDSQRDPVATDGVLSDSFLHMEVESAEAAAKSTLHEASDECPTENDELLGLTDQGGSLDEDTTAHTPALTEEPHQTLDSATEANIYNNGHATQPSRKGFWQRLFGTDSDEDESFENSNENDAEFFRP